MKNKLYIFCVLFFLFSCTSRTIYKKPENLIAKDKMVDIWVDMYIASATKNTKTTDLEKNINYLPLVLKKYNIDSIQFSESNIYYTSKIDEYQKMFEEVNKKLIDIKNIYDPETKLDTILRKQRRIQKLD